MTVEAWAAAIEATALAGTLRASVWAYPMVNAGHILGVALLVGAIVPLDLRLIGFWPSVPVASLWRVLTRTAGVGLGLAIVCGVLLFTARAMVYAESSLFIAKMIVVAAGAFNALILHVTVPDERRLAQSAFPKLPSRVRSAAYVSLAAWLTALTLGRLVGYF